MNSSSQDEAIWLCRLAEGNEQAFKHFYDSYSHAVLLVARRYVGPEAARDVVQEVFTKIWLKRTRFRQMANFKGYIIKTTWTTALKHQKKAIRIELAATEFTERLAFSEQDRYRNEQFEEIILQLTPRQQAIYHLAKVEGLAYQEIAELLDISKNTVTNHMTAILKFIKSHKLKFKAAMTLLLLMLATRIG